MLAKGRAINSLKGDRVPQQGAHLATTKQQQQQQILRENQQRRSNNDDITSYLDEPLPGGNRNKQQASNESESTHTSSASSSGYLSHIGVINPQHYHNGSNALTHTEQRSGAQLAPSYHTNSVKPQQFHAHQLMFGDGNEREVSARMIPDKKIGNGLRQVSANYGEHLTNRAQANHQQFHQYQHQHHHRHLSECADESGRFRTLVAPSMAVPMMIDDELDDSDGVDVDVEVDVDGNHLIDDDIDRRLADEHSDEGGNALDGDDIAANNTISAFDPHALYGIPANGLRNQSSRENGDHQRRRRRPLLASDCVDSTLALLKNVNGDFQHPNRYNQHHQSIQAKPTAQNGDSNNNQLAQYHQQQHHVMPSTRHSIQTDAQTRLVYNPLSTANTYQVANNCKQPTSLVYQPAQQHQSFANLSSYADQLQQQYHSFSYHQPAQQLQLASLNQRQIQLPTYHSQQLAAPVRSAPVSERGAGSGSASASSASSVFSPDGRKELERAVSKGKTKANNSKSKSKEAKKMQQGGSRQQLGSPADQHRHHSSGSHRKTGATSRKQPASGNRSSSNQLAISKHDRGSSLSCCGKMAKLLLFITNILFWVSRLTSIINIADLKLGEKLFETDQLNQIFEFLAKSVGWSCFIRLGDLLFGGRSQVQPVSVADI